MKGHTIKGGHKRPTKSGAGMTKKGVAKYRRDNPGSKLKTAVTGKVKKGSKAAKRRKVLLRPFCRPDEEVPKAAKNPNSRFVRLENAGSAIVDFLGLVGKTVPAFVEVSPYIPEGSGYKALRKKPGFSKVHDKVAKNTNIAEYGPEYYRSAEYKRLSQIRAVSRILLIRLIC